ncbi:MAG TPA: hypothetical protein VK324_14865 [Tepidisphaeraceae bacterium]|nr:hypothetical protein [Tepidisphaeraceae bacterium]
MALAAFAASAAGRAVEHWPYDRLFEEADVVVIAAAQETAASDDAAPDGRWRESLVGQRTTFAVIKPLKGQLDDGPVTVVHFKLKDGVVSQNGPLLVAFRTKGPTIRGGERVKYNVMLGTPQYLLFLKRTDGGRFEPVSGQFDPALSVKEIYAPLPAVIDER